MDFLQSLDTSVAVFFGGIDCVPLDYVMAFFSLIAEYGVVFILTAALIFFIRREKYEAADIICALIINIILSFALKNIIDRPRPYEALDLSLFVPVPNGSSFPSAHSSSAFAAATVIFIYDRRRLPVFAWLYVALAALIAFSRVYLCVHYPSDVIAGAVLGIIIGAATALTVKKLSTATH